ncbi:hypothetical protein WI666_08790 [Vibrio cholerae]
MRSRATLGCDKRGKGLRSFGMVTVGENAVGNFAVGSAMMRVTTYHSKCAKILDFIGE